MKKTQVKLPEAKPEADKVKRVYRAALDTIRRLDEPMKQKKAYRDVFLPEAVCLRSRLQDYCERLMFYDPLEYGRKAEELLWRKVYYDIIQLMKHNRKQMRPSSSLESAFRTHLLAATGYYHHLLFRLQCDFHLKLEGIIDFFHVPEPRAHKKPHQVKKGEPSPEVQDWARRACHKCLNYLGDLARYQQDYDEAGSNIISQRYYYQALMLAPDIGMPYNQLGTLAGSRYYNLDAVYYYLRCLTCTTTFEGAHGNLHRLFEKNRKRHQEVTLSSPRDLPPEQQRSKDIKRFAVRFMHLLDLLLNYQGVDSKGLQDACQATLQDFNLCMFYQPPHVTNPQSPRDVHQNEDKIQYLDDETVFKIAVMCMITIYQLQKSGSRQVTAAIAFSLAFFSHVLNHVVIRLQSALTELENPRKVLQVDSGDEKYAGTTDDDSANRSTNDDGNDTQEHSAESSAEKPQDGKQDQKMERRRHRVHKLRRRRRRRCDSDSTNTSTHSGSSEEEQEGQLTPDEEEEDLSETELKDDEDIDYLHHSGSSDSDSEDNLMVSQELRPGFSITANTEQLEEGLKHLETIQEGPGLDMALHALIPASYNNMDRLNANVNAVNGGRHNSIPDMDEYLKDLPTDWFMDSSSFLQQTLKLNDNFNHMNMEQDEVDYEVCKAVVQGKKEVRVPPGFDKAPEAQHVLEITQKMADFVIETDTDTSNMPTDTDNSSIPTESELETETGDSSAESVIDKCELEEQRLERLIHVITNEGLLCAIKVYCDWMKCHPQIIATCAQSSQSLWSRLSVLLNFLPLEIDLAKMEFCRTEAVLKIVQKAATLEWEAEEPLREDRHLHMFPPLKEAHGSIVFDFDKRLDLTQQQEAILRICCLRKFGYFITKIKSISFKFDREKRQFYGPLQLKQSQVEEQALPDQTADAEARRTQLMKDMAQLRLQAEVSQLEGSLQSADQPSLPPYLVPDASALCDSLNQVKQLTNSARFIVIIPLAVIDHLDFLKKESAGAREAIRWLEAEFRKGNRYVRAQKNHEKTSTVPQKNMKKKDKEAWRFFQMVDCCKYLAQQSSHYDPKGMVCILTNQRVYSQDVSLRVKQAVMTAKQEGIGVQNVESFFTQWKDLWKSSKG